MSENAVWFHCETCDKIIRTAKYWVRENRWVVSAHSDYVAEFFETHSGWEHTVRVFVEDDGRTRETREP